MVAPVDLEVDGEGLGNEFVTLHHLVQHFVGLDGGHDVAFEHLQARPEGQEGVHVVAGVRVRSGN